MKRLLLISGIALGVAACGSSARVNTPIGTTASTGTPTTVPRFVAHVGTTLSLTDETVGLSKVIDPAVTDASGIGAPAGKHLVAAVLVVTNTSSTGFTPQAPFDSTLIDNAGQSYTPTLWPTGSCQAFASSAVVEPNTSLTGCVVFEVTDGNTPARFQYQPRDDPKFGEWLIP